MSLENAPVGDGAPAPAADTPADTVSSAAAALAQRRWEKTKQAQAPADPPSAEAVETPQQDLPETADDARPQEGDPVETTETPEPEAPPSTIEPPRSWTKAEKERFATLPRETQEYIAQREQEREREIRRSQNEAAEARKAIDAERTQAEQARKQYERALPALLQALQEQEQGEFADIKTMADVERLAREDWPRYALWDAQQKKIAAVHAEIKSSQERQAHEYRNQWAEYARKQDELLADHIPELSDPAKAKQIAEGAVKVLKEIGFSDQELAAAWNGEASVSLRDHRLQQLIYDGVRYREAKANLSKPTPKPVPQVQRPGAAEPRNAGAVQTVQTLSKKLETSGKIEDAVALIQARRAAAARRA